MKIYFYSDLHLENRQSESYFLNLLDKANIDSDSLLILSGDIYSNRNDIKRWGKLTTKFNHIYYLNGNHEYYGSEYSIDELKSNLNFKVYDNVSIINNEYIDINNMRLIFSTMFTKINLAHFHLTKYINDFTQIKGFTLDKWNEIYENSIQFIFNSIDTNKNNIVFTHHSPSFLLVDKRYKGEYQNCLFHTELFNNIADNDSIHYWIYGHTHSNICDTINTTVIQTNQLGYHLSKDFNINKHLII